MAHEDGIELFRKDDGDLRVISLSPFGSGLEIGGQDIGPKVKAFWGDNDYEFWVRVPGHALRNLAFALLRERFSGREQAVDEFREFCARNGIDHEFDSWV